MQLDLYAGSRFFESIVATVQTDLDQLVDWWGSIDSTYRAAGCFLASMLLMLEATRFSDRDRKFFLYGFISLALLAYAALLFVERSRL